MDNANFQQLSNTNFTIKQAQEWVKDTYNPKEYADKEKEEKLNNKAKEAAEQDTFIKFGGNGKFLGITLGPKAKAFLEAIEEQKISDRAMQEFGEVLGKTVMDISGIGLVADYLEYADPVTNPYSDAQKEDKQNRQQLADTRRHLSQAVLDGDVGLHLNFDS